MRPMKRIYILIMMLIMGAALVSPLASAPVWAANSPGGEGGGGGTTTTGGDPLINKDDKCPNGVRIGLPIFGTANCVTNDKNNGGAIIAYLKTVLQLLSIAASMVIILMLIVAGIQYITSIGDPGQIKAAKTRVTNAITALVLFLLMYAILSFLVPGGIF
jgi:hypothetical protein